MSEANIWFEMMTPAQKKARRIEKINAILIWLARYNWSVLTLISILLKIDMRNARAALQILEAQGLLVSDLLPSGFRVYGLTPSGIAEVYNINHEIAKSARPFKKGSVPDSTFAHQYNVQLAEFSLSNFGWHAFSTSRELYYLKSKQVPDLVGFDDNDILTALEVELNIKSTQRMKVVCKNYCEVLGVELDPCTLYQRVLYLTPYPKRLSKLLDDLVPAEKRWFFSVEQLYLPPLLLTPRRIQGGGK
jgi:hypothetical protein